MRSTTRGRRGKIRRVEESRDGCLAKRPQPNARLSSAKKATYAALVTIALFSSVEGLLLLFNFESILVRQDPYVGFESRIPLFVEQTAGEGAYLHTAPNKLDYFNAQRFPKKKPENTIRIFCLGGSTTFGRPYDDATSFVGWLRELLQVATTGQQWEVINAGGISYASYRVATVMEELCAYSPDIFIVYTGHNEFLEERTYRDLHAVPAGVRRLTAVLQTTRTYSTVHRLLRKESLPGGRDLLPGEVDTLLDHASGPSSYQRDDQLRADILKHFEFNLARMIEMARSADAQILMVTPAANLKDFSPLKSEHRSALEETGQKQWQSLFTKATVLEERGDLRAALVALDAAGDIDDRYAELHFRTGRLLFAQGQFAEARPAFLRAIEEDVCPLRAVPEIQRIVERIVTAQRVPLVDFDSVVRNDCVHRYGHDSPGREYFVDHVHPTIAAHRLLATAIFEVMLRKGIVTPNGRWRSDAVELATRRVESRVDPERQARAMTNVAQVLSWAGKQEEAGPIALEAVRLRSERGLAEEPESLFYAAVHLAMTGSHQQATQLFKQVVQHEPGNAQARWRLATLLYNLSQYEEAKHHFSEAVRLNPSDTYSRQMMEITSSKLEK